MPDETCSIGNNDVYPGLMDYVIIRLIKGDSAITIFEDAKFMFNYQNNKEVFYKYCSNVRMRHLVSKSERYKRALTYLEDTDEKKEFVKKLTKKLKLKKMLSLDECASMLSLNIGDLALYIDYARSIGYNIICHNNNVFIDLDESFETDINQKDPLSDTTEIIFGVITDTHFGSRACQITALNEYATIAKSQGVKHILHIGDMFAGFGIYKNQPADLYSNKAKDQINSAISNLPTGFDYYVLRGNHDEFAGQVGYNPIKILSSLREDIHYCGSDRAVIPILNGVDAVLWHPIGGTPYAYSYRLQKGLEEIVANELGEAIRGIKSPAIKFVFAGHLHIQLQMMVGNSIIGMQCGCFEGKTNFVRRLGKIPSVGGYIVKVSLDNQKNIKMHDIQFHCFPEIENDYLSYDHDVKDNILHTGPIFQWGNKDENCL